MMKAGLLNPTLGEGTCVYKFKKLAPNWPFGSVVFLFVSVGLTLPTKIKAMNTIFQLVLSVQES